MPKNIKEEAPTNSAGSGAIDGIGVGPRGEPGVSQKKMWKTYLLKMLRRKVYGTDRRRI